MTSPAQILKASRTILLIDWPSPAVPRALITAGLTVFGYSPRGYSKAELAPAPPPDVSSHSVFAPPDQTERGYLVFRPLPAPPNAVDIVAVYRPPAELPAILAKHTMPLAAKTVWFLRPLSSADERAAVERLSLTVVEDTDLVAAARAASGAT